MKILVAEDDFGCRKLIARLLSDHGETDIAVDGTEAVTAFKEALEEGQPYDLVALDVMMPTLDGHEVLKEIRALESGIDGVRPCKVVMTTARDDWRSVESAYANLCDDYMVKPIRRESLALKLRELGLA